MSVMLCLSSSCVLCTLREHLGSSQVFGVVGISHLISFLCCVICFAVLRPVSCVSNVTSVSGLSIIDPPPPPPSVFTNIY